MYSLKIKLIVLLVATLSILAVGYSTYSYVYNKGQYAAQLECAAKFAKYQQGVDAKVLQITDNLATLVANSQNQQQALNSDISEILARVKKSPVTVIKNNKCYPSPTFVEGINQAVDRANKR